MISPLPLPPPDPALSGLPTLLDGDAMAAALAAHLPACAAGRVAIERVEPNYVRYKRGTSCLVGFRLTLRDAETGEISALPASARLYADERGARRASGKKLWRLLDVVARTYPAPPVERAAYIPSLQALIQLWPVDYDLPALPLAASPTILGPAFATVVPAAARAELIRYKPARKALFRYGSDDGALPAVYGKLLPDDRGAGICALAHALRRQGVPTPAPLAYLPNEQLLFHAAAPGRPLASLRGDRTYRDALEPTAEALDRLHASTHPVLTYDPTLEGTAIRAAAHAVATLVPHLAGRAERLGNELAAALSRLPTDCATVHGDFYDDQVLVASDGVTLVDLDEARLGHPLLDAGNFLAHLTAAGDPDEARSAFLDAYRHHNAAPSSEVALFETIGLLKLAIRPFRHLDPDWPTGVETILNRTEECWRETQVERIPVGIDPLLPSLRSLGDPNAMTSILTRDVYSAPVRVCEITLIRHKPGRRAIFRYDLDVGADGNRRRERLYGKTFASERGPRVFEALQTITAAQVCGPGVRLPEPVAYLPDLKLLLQRAVPGDAITPSFLEGDTHLAVEIAEAIHALHTSGVDLPRRHDLARELDPLAARVEQLGTRSPAFARAACRCLALIERRQHRAWNWRWRPIHRDFYHDQVLAGEHGLSILDFDDAAISEPAVDVANLLAHLRLLAIQHPAAGDGPSRCAAAFAHRYRRLDSDLDPMLVRFLEGATLLRLAEIHQPRAEGDRIAARLLTTSEHLLRTTAYRTTRSRPCRRRQRTSGSMKSRSIGS
ncbi:MAG: phosphotransferase [Thermomicrobiales bacterium]